VISSNPPRTKCNYRFTLFPMPSSPQMTTNSSSLFTSPSAMPGESPFCQHTSLTQTRNLEVRKQPPPWLFQWPYPTLPPCSPRSTFSPETKEWSRCSPPPRTPSARSAGNLATFPTTAPAHYPSVPSALWPTRNQSIAALTLTALRVVTSNRSWAAACSL